MLQLPANRRKLSSERRRFWQDNLKSNDWVIKLSIIALILVIVCLGVIAVLTKLKGRKAGNAFYEAKGNLLTPAELKFLAVLDQVIGSHYRIMAQVR